VPHNTESHTLLSCSTAQSGSQLGFISQMSGSNRRGNPNPDTTSATAADSGREDQTATLTGASARRIQDAWRRHISRQHEGNEQSSENETGQPSIPAKERWEDALIHAETRVWTAIAYLWNQTNKLHNRGEFELRGRVPMTFAPVGREQVTSPSDCISKLTKQRKIRQLHPTSNSSHLKPSIGLS
jgi:hypothetical protein